MFERQRNPNKLPNFMHVFNTVYAATCDGIPDAYLSDAEVQRMAEKPALEKHTYVASHSALLGATALFVFMQHVIDTKNIHTEDIIEVIRYFLSAHLSPSLLVFFGFIPAHTGGYVATTSPLSPERTALLELCFDIPAVDHTIASQTIGITYDQFAYAREKSRFERCCRPYLLQDILPIQSRHIYCAVDLYAIQKYIDLPYFAQSADLYFFAVDIPAIVLEHANHSVDRETHAHIYETVTATLLPIVGDRPAVLAATTTAYTNIKPHTLKLAVHAFYHNVAWTVRMHADTTMQCVREFLESIAPLIDADVHTVYSQIPYAYGVERATNDDMYIASYSNTRNISSYHSPFIAPVMCIDRDSIVAYALRDHDNQRTTARLFDTTRVYTDDDCAAICRVLTHPDVFSNITLATAAAVYNLPVIAAARSLANIPVLPHLWSRAMQLQSAYFSTSRATNRSQYLALASDIINTVHTWQCQYYVTNAQLPLHIARLIQCIVNIRRFACTDRLLHLTLFINVMHFCNRVTLESDTTRPYNKSSLCNWAIWFFLQQPPSLEIVTVDNTEAYDRDMTHIITTIPFDADIEEHPDTRDDIDDIIATISNNMLATNLMHVQRTPDPTPEDMVRYNTHYPDIADLEPYYARPPAFRKPAKFAPKTFEEAIACVIDHIPAVPHMPSIWIDMDMLERNHITIGVELQTHTKWAVQQPPSRLFTPHWWTRLHTYTSAPPISIASPNINTPALYSTNVAQTLMAIRSCILSHVGGASAADRNSLYVYLTTKIIPVTDYDAVTRSKLSSLEDVYCEIMQVLLVYTRQLI
jgi:hypothetical protein